MILGWKQMIGGYAKATAMCLLGVVMAGGQSAPAPAQKELMAEDVYKNVQVLRGIPENQFLATMGFFAASLNESCEFCHKSEATWDAYAIDNPQKQMARRMVLMVKAINQANFGGKRMVTCYTCHRGSINPVVTPDLDLVYSTMPPVEDPDDIAESAPGAPPADQILDKYIQALGGAQRLNGLTSFVAKGTYEGYSAAEGEKRGIEIYAKAPGERTTIMHTINGDMTTAYDSRTGWVAEPGRPVPLLALTGLFLDAAKVEADLSFPGRIKQVLSNWRVGDSLTLNGKDVDVVYATSASGAPVKMYFDQMSGLLVRLVRFTESPIGRDPIRTDYSDYQPVSGVLMPFHQTLTWLDGRATITLTDIQANLPIDASKFAKPAAPKPIQ